MIYFKSILAGIVAFVVTAVLYLVGIILYVRFYLLPRNPPPPGAEVGFDLSSIGVPLWLGLFLAVLAFAAGFYAMFKRSSVP